MKSEDYDEVMSDLAMAQGASSSYGTSINNINDSTGDENDE